MKQTGFNALPGRGGSLRRSSRSTRVSTDCVQACAGPAAASIRRRTRSSRRPNALASILAGSTAGSPRANPEISKALRSLESPANGGNTGLIEIVFPDGDPAQRMLVASRGTRSGLLAMADGVLAAFVSQHLPAG